MRPSDRFMSIRQRPVAFACYSAFFRRVTVAAMAVAAMAVAAMAVAAMTVAAMAMAAVAMWIRRRAVERVMNTIFLHTVPELLLQVSHAHSNLLQFGKP